MPAETAPPLHTFCHSSGIKQNVQRCPSPDPQPMAATGRDEEWSRGGLGGQRAGRRRPADTPLRFTPPARSTAFRRSTPPISPTPAPPSCSSGSAEMFCDPRGQRSGESDSILRTERKLGWTEALRHGLASPLCPSHDNAPCCTQWQRRASPPPHTDQGFGSVTPRDRREGLSKPDRLTDALKRSATTRPGQSLPRLHPLLSYKNIENNREQ